jgi:hypothetical protein
MTGYTTKAESPAIRTGGCGAFPLVWAIEELNLGPHAYQALSTGHEVRH